MRHISPPYNHKNATQRFIFTRFNIKTLNDRIVKPPKYLITEKWEELTQMHLKGKKEGGGGLNMIN
jgi:hypothetical protein